MELNFLFFKIPFQGIVVNASLRFCGLDRYFLFELSGRWLAWMNHLSSKVFRTFLRFLLDLFHLFLLLIFVHQFSFSFWFYDKRKGRIYIYRFQRGTWFLLYFFSTMITFKLYHFWFSCHVVSSLFFWLRSDQKMVARKEDESVRTLYGIYKTITVQYFSIAWHRILPITPFCNQIRISTFGKDAFKLVWQSPVFSRSYYSDQSQHFVTK